MLDAPVPASDTEIGFAADTIDYNSETDVVTARGNVQMLREGNRLRADTVSWNRKTELADQGGRSAL